MQSAHRFTLCMFALKNSDFIDCILDFVLCLPID